MNDKPRVAIVDYQMCNLFSVVHACIATGLEPVVTSDPAEIGASDAVILPGVGAFKDAVENMRSLGLDAAVERAIAADKPFLGICLGFQMLFERSEEFGESVGLGILPGNVLRFPGEFNGQRLKVPQIGWNRVRFQKASRLLQGIRDGEYFYFVHSFYVEPHNHADVLTRSTYRGFDYCSSVERGRLFACQFHPEKSASEGMNVYRNWAQTICQ